MKTVLIGAGSLGTIIGALISKNGGNILLVDKNIEHVRALNENGATITGGLELANIRVKACIPQDLSGKYDLVIYLVKNVFNEEALKQILPYLHEESIVCTLQNGIPEDEVSEYVGRERTIGGTVGWGASWQSPGVSKLTSSKKALIESSFVIGEMDGRITERLKEVKKILDLVGNTVITDNLIGIRWSKLFINSTLSGMSASLGCTYGDVLDNEKALTCAAYIGNEIIKITKVKGINIESFQGYDLSKFEFENETQVPEILKIYQDMFSPHRSIKASMLNDLCNNIFKTEIDYINGKVVSEGKKVGIPTPFNEKVVELVKTAARKHEIPNFKNIDKFILL
jgi:2-dehydropantoate 2-reductase